MKQYIGTKLINAKPMTRGEYNKYRGWEVPDNENPEDAGYLVEYQDSPIANTPDHAGYVSWSPKDVFDKAYRQSDGMPFGLAIEALKRGFLVSRKGWNGKGMWLQLIKPLSDVHLAYIQMKTVDDTYVPWLASQTDMLADDWTIVECRG